MRRTVAALILTVAVFAATGFANTNSLTAEPGWSPAVRRTSMPSPTLAGQAPATGSAGPTTIHWDTFYDAYGNPLPGVPEDNVGPDSLYFKKWNVTDTLYGCPKSEVPDPTPASCRTGFAFIDGQNRVGMDPAGNYIYEVDGSNLRRHSTSDGAVTDFTISNGNNCCMTDGSFLYVPVDNVVYKYTMTGTLVSQTTLDITPLQWVFSVAHDTVWCGTRSTTLNGYACSKFTGGSLTPDATWSLGSADGSGVLVCWDGTYYYASWNGNSSPTFKRYNPDRTLSASGTIDIDPRGVMCSGPGTRQVTQDSLYWKLVTSATNLYSSPKAQDVTAAQPTSLSWQNSQTVPCMTPDGQYVFEVDGTNMRRSNLMTGAVANYTLANAGEGSCGTDGQYVYVPNGTATRKYTLAGVLVSTTTTDYAPRYGYGFGVANDTVWLTPADSGKTWYGYACSKFTGGSITHDATWTTDGGDHTGMTVAYDGQYYYMVWGGHSSNTFLRFYRDRTLYSTGTVTGDARGVMCMETVCPLVIMTTGPESYRAELAETLKVASGGILGSIGTYSVQTNATFPATEWYDAGCRVILEFSGSLLPTNPALVGESLAKFVDLGGRVVTAMWADHTGNLAGRYVTQYMPFTMKTQPSIGGSMGTVHDPLHPIMDGVTAISAGNYITGNTHSTLRSSNCVCLAEWDSGNRSVLAYFDSADVRLASVGFVPFKFHSGATGQWAKLLVNALLWAWPGMPTVGVTVPDTGNVWYVGTAHDITWTAANGPITRDSIVYSYDNGVTWNFLDKYTGSRTSYTWDPIPNTPNANCYVRVFSWNATGSACGTSGKFEIRVPGHDVGVLQIIQPVDTVDSGATVVPTAAVKNFGDIEETFPVRFSIGGFYATDTSVTIGPGATDTVTFPDWVVGQIGTHAVRCSTRLAGDQNNANDLALDTVIVVPPGGIAQPENNALPLVFALYQSCPNPLASGAAIRYALPRPARVELRIYDVAGTLVRRLVDGVQAAGYRRAYWDGRDDRGSRVAPGVYYCRFRAGDYLAARKLVVRR